jgi:hypothetical protein
MATKSLQSCEADLSVPLSVCDEPQLNTNGMFGDVVGWSRPPCVACAVFAFCHLSLVLQASPADFEPKRIVVLAKADNISVRDDQTPLTDCQSILKIVSEVSPRGVMRRGRVYTVCSSPRSSMKHLL